MSTAHHLTFFVPHKLLLIRHTSSNKADPQTTSEPSPFAWHLHLAANMDSLLNAFCLFKLTWWQCVKWTWTHLCAVCLTGLANKPSAGRMSYGQFIGVQFRALFTFAYNTTRWPSVCLTWMSHIRTSAPAVGDPRCWIILVENIVCQRHSVFGLSCVRVNVCGNFTKFTT